MSSAPTQFRLAGGDGFVIRRFNLVALLAGTGAVEIVNKARAEVDDELDHLRRLVSSRAATDDWSLAAVEWQASGDKTVVVAGDIDLVIESAQETHTISGRGSTTWIEHRLTNDTATVRAGATEIDPSTDLALGVVRAAGFEIVFDVEAPADPALASSVRSQFFRTVDNPADAAPTAKIFTDAGAGADNAVTRDGQPSESDSDNVRSDSILQLTAADGQLWKIAGSVVLGRRPDPSNLSAPEILGSLAINDLKLSRNHAIIRVISDEILIEDCGSTNGTSVTNPSEVAPVILAAGQPTPLRHGAVISVGEQRLAVEFL